MLITENFDSRTLSSMEIALERACQTLSIVAADHEFRRHVANKIIECAERGDRTLGGLTEAGRVAANELCVAMARNAGVGERA